MKALDGDFASIVRGHAVIEASAGTGKTYTIEHLVLQILRDFPAVQISNILIVTFTDKAAGELKSRVRARLEDALADPFQAGYGSKFREALEQFDSAPISTIHAFCNGILNEFPFESSRPLELDAGSDAAAVLRLFQEIVRNEWTRLPPGFFMGRTVVGPRGGKTREKSVIDRCLALSGDIISAAGSLRDQDTLLPDFPDRLQDCGTPDQIAAWTAAELRRRIRMRRQGSATITYDDMILNVAATLNADHHAGSRLLEILRRRYRFGLIDEFQDTDPDQWSIFRRIFVDGGAPCEPGGSGNTLIVVGDPKQAIYQFRGADIKTYFDACDALQESGEKILLRENFRSTPEVIDGLNCVFDVDSWFRDPADKPIHPIDFFKSAAPEGAAHRKALAADLSGRGAVVPVWLGEGTAEEGMTVQKCRWTWGSFVAAEILRLMNPATGVKLRLPNPANPGETTVRAPRFDDFCVLGRFGKDIVSVSESLAERGIPWSAYKQRTLYKSPEALEIRVLMEYLAGGDDGQGGDAAAPIFFSRIFFPGGDLAALAEPGRMERINSLLAAWRNLARLRQWELLFENVAKNSGLFEREALEVDGERRLSNWRQIFEELVSAADAGSLDARGLVRHLSGLGSVSDDAGDDSLISRLESESPKVRLMTCHAAKGLQFPFVFVCGGFTADHEEKGLVRCYDESGSRFFVFSEDGKIDKRFVIDRDEKRLYYVALTRAVYKVYFPVGFKNARGDSAVRRVLSASLEALVGGRPGESRVWTLIDAAGRPRDPETKEVMGETGSVAPLAVGEAGQSGPPVQFDLSPAARISWYKRRLRLDSYSSLAGKGGRNGRAGALPESAKEPRDDDDFDDVDGNDMVLPANVLLPAGKMTGTAFHGIMEALSGGRSPQNPEGLDFSAFGVSKAFEDTFAAVGDLVRLHLARNGILNRQAASASGVVDGADRQMTRLLKNALQTMLSPHAPLNFSMSDIRREDAVAEVEFHLDENILGMSRVGAAPGVLPGVTDGLLNGFIDLVFRKDGRYWFLDWKTTSIRPGAVPPDADGNVDEWSAASVNDAMEHGGYLVQAHVYRLALLQWLSRVYGDGGAARFGGGIFLFARGMTGPGRAVWNSIDLFNRENEDASRAFIARRIGLKTATGGVDES